MRHGQNRPLIADDGRDASVVDKHDSSMNLIIIHASRREEDKNDSVAAHRWPGLSLSAVAMRPSLSRCRAREEGSEEDDDRLLRQVGPSNHKPNRYKDRAGW
jgi:hypothetical protein